DFFFAVAGLGSLKVSNRKPPSGMADLEHGSELVPFGVSDGPTVGIHDFLFRGNGFRVHSAEFNFNTKPSKRSRPGAKAGPQRAPLRLPQFNFNRCYQTGKAFA